MARCSKVATSHYSLEMKQQIKRTLGKILVSLMPHRAEQVRQNEFSMSVGHRNPLNSLIRAGLAERLVAGDQLDELSANHRQFWATDQGTEYHIHARRHVTDSYQQYFSYVNDILRGLLLGNREITTLVEVGCGGGSLLDLLAKEFPQIERFVGIDLSPAIIAENKRIFEDPRLEWVVENGKTWVEQTGGANTIYLSYRGVYEYFTQADLDEMFAKIASEKRPAISISIEPIGLEHDLDTTQNSVLYGTEYTFSHNYPHLYRKNGYTIHSVKRNEYDTHAICAVVASVGLKQREPDVEDLLAAIV